MSLFSPFATPLPTTPYSLRQSPHHGSCPWVIHINSLATQFHILYCTSPWLFCNYLFVLTNPPTSLPILHTLLPSGNNQNSLCIHDSVSVLACLDFFFLHSVVDRFVVFAIFLFIVLIFFFLSKSL